MYKSILLAIDGSECSFRAAQEVVQFAHPETIVTILNVAEVEAVKYDFLHKAPENTDRMKPIQKTVDLFEKENVNYELKLEQGSPSRIVVNAANSGKYDAVVIGSRGLNAFQEMMLGSVSHKVTLKSEIPVILVK